MTDRRARAARRWRTPVAGLVLAGALAACGISGGPATSDGPADDPTDGGVAGSTSAPAAPDPPRSTLRWRSCDDDLECATLAVPVDADRPDGPTLDLALARRPATDPDRRLGSLLLNPGGPGISAIDFIAMLPLPSGIASRFDIVAFDPRGVGRSSPLECHSNLQAMYDADPTIDEEADKTRFVAASRAYVDECRAEHADLLPHLGTRDVARDMDRVRAALGEDQLNYVGYSYGTSIGQQYADLFPTRIRAMVLDGIVDTSLSGLAAADLQAKGFESALATYLRSCRPPGCELGTDPGATVDRVIAAAEREPIPSPGADRPATPGVVELGIAQALYSPQLWPALTDALGDADDGDGTGLVELADQYLRREPDGSYPNGSEVYFAVSCLDSAWPADVEAVFAAAKETGRTYPRLGEGLVNDYARCAMWPTPPKPLPAVTAPGSAPILVISTTGDPATPYESGVAVAGRLSRGVLLTNEGEGHTIFGQGKDCVDDAVTAYLVDLDVPPDGLRCR